MIKHRRYQKEAMTDLGLYAEKFPTLEKAVDVMILECHEATQSVKLSIEIDASREMQEKALLCAIYAIDDEGEVIAFDESSWPRSTKLSAPYQYLPGFEGVARFDMRRFESEFRISTLFVALFPWSQSIPHGDAKFSRCFAGVQMNLDGRSFTSFNQLRRMERAND